MNNAIFKYDIITIHSPNYLSRKALISGVVIHSIGLEICEILDLFLQTDSVSAHYFIPQISSKDFISILEKYRYRNIDSIKQAIKYPNHIPVIQFVDDEDTAFHAGESKFKDFNQLHGCDRSLNHCTIGVEFHSPSYGGKINDKGEYNLFDFKNYTKDQIECGIMLLHHLHERHLFPKENVFSHSTIALGRKTDPGPYFPWNLLRKNGFGHSPQEIDWHDVNKLKQQLIEIGFNIKDERGLTYAIIAYILEFAPDLWDSSITFNSSLDEILSHAKR
jgi:N-acetyl-anhydromuramyl-L-alanine amidase AmpD